MSDKTNVLGRKTHETPPGGNPTPGGNSGTKNSRHKRKKSDKSSSGFTPENKLQNQGKLNLKNNPDVASKGAAEGPKPVPGQSGQPASILSASNNGKDSLGASNYKMASGPSSQPASILSASKGDDSSVASNNQSLTASNTKSVVTEIPKSPASVTNALENTHILSEEQEKLLESSDVELEDLTREEESEIQAEILGESDEPPAKKSYASTVAKKKAFEVLYIHLGTNERSPIGREQFQKLYDRLQTQVLDRILKGENPPDRVLWRSWSKGRGLVATEDKETSEFICDLVKTTTLQKQNFRAWHRGEFGFSRLVTGHLEGNSMKSFSHDNVMLILMKQNKLSGEYTGVKFTDSESGRLLKFFANKEMWEDLMSRRSNMASSKVRMKLGISPVTFTLSKPKQEAMDTDDAGSTTAQGEPTESEVPK